MNKGIIMDMTSKHWIILTRDGQFVKVARKNRFFHIGDEVSIPDHSRYARWMPYASAAAAAVCICLIILAGWFGQWSAPGPRMVAAYVSLDINPSVELAVDQQRWVLEARGLNEKGRILVNAVDLDRLKVEEAAVMLFNQAEAKSFLRPYWEQGSGSILISSTVVTEGALDDIDLMTQVEQKILESISARHPDKAGTFAVAKLSAPESLREEAVKNGVSAGRAAIKLLSEEQGHFIAWEDLQEASIEEVSREAAGLRDLIFAEQGLTREKLAELYEWHKQTAQSLDPLAGQEGNDADEQNAEEPDSMETLFDPAWNPRRPDAANSDEEQTEADPQQTETEQQPQSDPQQTNTGEQETGRGEQQEDEGNRQADTGSNGAGSRSSEDGAGEERRQGAARPDAPVQAGANRDDEDVRGNGREDQDDEEDEDKERDKENRRSDRDDEDDQGNRGRGRWSPERSFPPGLEDEDDGRNGRDDEDDRGNGREGRDDGEDEDKERDRENRRSDRDEEDDRGNGREDQDDKEDEDDEEERDNRGNGRWSPERTIPPGLEDENDRNKRDGEDDRGNGRGKRDDEDNRGKGREERNDEEDERGDEEDERDDNDRDDK